jgi:hypothetical protein
MTMFGFKRKKQEKALKAAEAANPHTPPPANKPTVYPQPPYGRWAPEIQAMIDAGVKADTIDQARLEFTRGTKDYDAFIEGAFAGVGIDIADSLATYKGSN